MFRRRHDDERTTTAEETVVEKRDDHAWGGPPIVRGLLTLLGVAAAGFLVWFATQFDLGSTGEYWAAMGILAGAGACLGLSQLFGGWTKWGAPTISSGVFFLAFLPTLIAVGGILVATRPTETDESDQVAGWIRDIGLGGLAEDLILFQGVFAFALGIVFAFTFDTRGPRARAPERDAVVPDEEVHDYRREEPVDEGETGVQERTTTVER
ncbi:MAG: hypothetical protein ACREJR_10605 [Candidatus Rokuibacteriota bacterium]